MFWYSTDEWKLNNHSSCCDICYWHDVLLDEHDGSNQVEMKSAWYARSHITLTVSSSKYSRSCWWSRLYSACSGIAYPFSPVRVIARQFHNHIIVPFSSIDLLRACSLWVGTTRNWLIAEYDLPSLLSERGWEVRLEIAVALYDFR